MKPVSHCLLFVLLLMLSPASAHSQVSEELVPRTYMIRFVLRNLVSTIDNPKIIKELELSDAQRRDMKKIVEDYNKAMPRVVGKVSEIQNKARLDENLSEDEKKELASKAADLSRKLFGELAEDADARLKKILLEHQYTRIIQISYRRELFRQRGNGFKVLEGMIGSAKISNEEKFELKQKLAKLKEAYQDDLAKLQKSTQEKALKILPIETRKQLEKAVGEFNLFELGK